MSTRTIQMTIDSVLLDEVDEAALELDVSRSALIRSALTEYLLQLRLGSLERQDREAYARVPATDDDADFWEGLQDWGAT
jgi:metal-responsive CopG/Arc/MetJ family transcriptional regulator